MKLDHDEMKKACFDLAKNTMWDQKPMDIKDVDSRATHIERIALSYVDYLEDSGIDPNILVRAIKDLDHSQAIPAMQNATTWFTERLAAIIELAYPTAILNSKTVEIFVDVEKGIKEAHESLEE